jgi:hypothetical protein
VLTILDVSPVVVIIVTVVVVIRVVRRARRWRGCDCAATTTSLHFLRRRLRSVLGRIFTWGRWWGVPRTSGSSGGSVGGGGSVAALSTGETLALGDSRPFKLSREWRCFDDWPNCKLVAIAVVVLGSGGCVGWVSSLAATLSLGVVVVLVCVGMLLLISGTAITVVILGLCVPSSRCLHHVKRTRANSAAERDAAGDLAHQRTLEFLGCGWWPAWRRDGWSEWYINVVLEVERGCAAALLLGARTR